jgi:hypothetical protein
VRGRLLFHASRPFSNCENSSVPKARWPPAGAKPGGANDPVIVRLMRGRAAKDAARKLDIDETEVRR